MDARTDFPDRFLQTSNPNRPRGPQQNRFNPAARATARPLAVAPRCRVVPVMPIELRQALSYFGHQELAAGGRSQPRSVSTTVPPSPRSGGQSHLMGEQTAQVRTPGFSNCRTWYGNERVCGMTLHATNPLVFAPGSAGVRKTRKP